MNKEKTKVIWLGRKKFSRDKLNVNCELLWGSTKFDLLGLKFSVDLEEMLDLNFNNAISKIENTFNHWNKRYLTPLGKITIIKTFIYSKINHLLSSLPNPPERILNKIEKLCFQFLWDNKPEKVKRSQIKQSKLNGGLNMVNLEHYIMATKVAWIRRLLTKENFPWINLFESIISKKEIFFSLGIQYTQRLILKCKNPFWKDTLESWFKLCKTNMPIFISRFCKHAIMAK